MSGIEFFLTRQIQAAEYHPKGWLWYLLDREGLQQDILQVLFNESPQFSQSLLGLSGPCVCVRQPRNGSFDLMVQSKSTAGEAVYLEIKADQKWETAQQNK